MRSLDRFQFRSGLHSWSYRVAVADQWQQQTSRKNTLLLTTLPYEQLYCSQDYSQAYTLSSTFCFLEMFHPFTVLFVQLSFVVENTAGLLCVHGNQLLKSVTLHFQNLELKLRIFVPIRNRNLGSIQDYSELEYQDGRNSVLSRRQWGHIDKGCFMITSKV